MKRPEEEQPEEQEQPAGVEWPDELEKDDDEEERVPRSGRRQLMPIERMR